MKQLYIILSLLLGSATLIAAEPVISKDQCTITIEGKTYALKGKVQIVENFPDLKVQIVESFPDIKVQIVNHLPNQCGQVQIVENFPDLKVQIVESFPDLKVQIVEHFPGVK